MDYEPEEQKRQDIHQLRNQFVDWDKHKINIIDTPGDSNFATDTQNCLRVADGGHRRR